MVILRPALLYRAPLHRDTDASQVWDSKPETPGAPINWVELKTSADIRPGNTRDVENFHRKLLKFWLQSFLLGVPRIIVGFRTHQGILSKVEEIQTETIPDTIARQQKPAWNGDMCINFGAEFMECK